MCGVVVVFSLSRLFFVSFWPGHSVWAWAVLMYANMICRRVSTFSLLPLHTDEMFTKLRLCIVRGLADWLPACLPNWLPIAHVYIRQDTAFFAVIRQRKFVVCIFLAFCRILAAHLSCVHQVAQLVTKSRTNRNIYIRYSTLVTDNLYVYCITLTKLLA